MSFTITFVEFNINFKSNIYKFSILLFIIIIIIKKWLQFSIF